MQQALTESPAALASVTDATDYTVQNRSERGMWLLPNASSAPANAEATDGAFLIAPFGTWKINNAAGNSAYVWLAAKGAGLGAAVYDVAD